MTIEMIVVLIVVSIIAYVIADRFQLIAPVLLIAAGVAVAFLPPGKEMGLPSTVVLTIFLPILLYWEALSVSLNRMRRSLRGIVLSATVLVAITAALIAVIGVLMGLGLGAALLIGACLGPTDATAVSSLGRDINPNGHTILQAESLLNDGTALAIFAIALQTAQDSSGVTVGFVAKDLLLAFGGGIGVGALLGTAVTKIGIRVRIITDDPMLATITALATPLVTFFLAEEIGGSGVLAVVTCGIIISRFAAPHMSLGSRVFGIPFWTILTYILNTILFIMVGVALPGIVNGLPRPDLVRGFILIPMVYVAMVVGRFGGHHLLIYSIRALDRRPQQRLRRTNLRGHFVSLVAGFRGAISLAMALSIPVAFDGAEYIERDLVILVVAGVTLLSLIVQGVALPYVVRWANERPSVGVQTAQATESQETDALAGVLSDAVAQIEAIANRAGVDDDEAIDAVRTDYERRYSSVRDADAEEEVRIYSGPESTLRLAIIDHLRERVRDLRFAGIIDDSTASNVIRRLDVETLHISGPIDVE
ncbi:Na+/H+ antiporter [Propionibacterium sp. oral taxon 192 str. F0372]|uniref:cation:proton antiporter n=1 Tax=Propionibacterium sp. oral taxon 192 TaxID=671222 RepID=UPI000352E585|nr:cation:proton antiporter [Propionibacterium sp. oral taxon 192]EPH02309.1 Na+/H+ antiporter [Propionibacterium sp. oral taxon 192 str. F0372]